MNFNIHRVSCEMGGKPLSIETGKLAKQADGSVLVSYGETRVLVTACSAKEPRAGADFFPLTVEFSEKFYAAGKIPGSFHKREGRPTMEATLSARMIDRPIRPLFPEGYFHDTQVVATILSVDTEADLVEALAEVAPRRRARRCSRLSCPARSSPGRTTSPDAPEGTGHGTSGSGRRARPPSDSRSRSRPRGGSRRPRRGCGAGWRQG